MALPWVGPEVGQFGRFHLYLAYFPPPRSLGVQPNLYCYMQTPGENLFVGTIPLASSQIPGILFWLQHSQIGRQANIEKYQYLRRDLDDPAAVERDIAEGRILPTDYDYNNPQSIVLNEDDLNRMRKSLEEEIAKRSLDYELVEQGIHELEQRYQVSAKDDLMEYHTSDIPPRMIDLERTQYTTLQSKLTSLFQMGSVALRYGDFHLHELHWKAEDRALTPTVYYAILLTSQQGDEVEVGITGMTESDKPGFRQRITICLLTFQERIDKLRWTIEHQPNHKNDSLRRKTLEVITSQQHAIQAGFEEWEK
jgi:hypothetical protein